MLVKLTDELLVDLYEVVSIKKTIFEHCGMHEARLDILYRNSEKNIIFLERKSLEEIDAEFKRIAGLFQQMYAPTDEIGATE